MSNLFSKRKTGYTGREREVKEVVTPTTHSNYQNKRTNKREVVCFDNAISNIRYAVIYDTKTSGAENFRGLGIRSFTNNNNMTNRSRFQASHQVTVY